jgi:hypothetical protein
MSSWGKYRYKREYIFVLRHSDVDTDPQYPDPRPDPIILRQIIFTANVILYVRKSQSFDKISLSLKL